jgi:hypothetical protein
MYVGGWADQNWIIALCDVVMWWSVVWTFEPMFFSKELFNVSLSGDHP